MSNIFNISASVSFLDALASGVLERFDDISKVTIFLPTRRAISQLRRSFIDAAEGEVMLLPKIEALGDIDEEEYFLKRYPNTDKIPQAISKTERLARLAKLIEEREEKLNFNQAMLLAKDFIALIDEIQNKKIKLENLEKLVPDEFSEHWQQNLHFLKIITEDWQEYKSEHGIIEPIERRNLLLASVVEYLKNNPQADPVIIAGTTGTVPATLQLVDTILANDNGYLVLDGMDKNFTEDEYAVIPQSHPQYNLSNMLRYLEARYSDIEEWKEQEITAREKLISTAMLPISRIDEWQGFSGDASELSFIECETNEEESSVISLVLREALEDKKVIANLVTNNRDLARRVSAKMKIWDVKINDSAGQQITKLPTSNFLLQMADMCASKFDAVKFLSFFKHPFIEVALKNQVRAIEKKHLRGLKIDGFKPWEYGIENDALKKFASYFESYENEFVDIFKAHIEAAKQIANEADLWGDKGRDVAECLLEIEQAAQYIGKVDTMLYPRILQSFMETKSFWPDYGLHPRLNIFSTIEARLQKADITILAGMNEGDFPQMQSVDAFLNQKMRADLGLDLPDRRIGQAAHDFELLSATGKVFYTRSLKSGGSPTTASRFMQTLTTIADLDEGEKYKAWARGLDAADVVRPCAQPKPAPPVSARPTKLSVTKIGKLMRDPYVVYAEKILRLRKLDEIGKDIQPADFGNFVHNAIENFSEVYDGKMETLLKCGEDELAKYGNVLAAKTFWWPRFEKIATWLIEKELSDRDEKAQIFHEIESSYMFGNFELTAKADRIEVTDKIRIIDYKTGAVPQNDEVLLGLEPQLPLEAVIFCNEYKKPLQSLEYWHVKGNANEDERVRYVNYNDMAELVQIAQDGIENLINEFSKEDTPYISTPRPSFALKYNDYEHLARNREWDS